MSKGISAKGGLPSDPHLTAVDEEGGVALEELVQHRAKELLAAVVEYMRPARTANGHGKKRDKQLTSGEVCRAVVADQGKDKVRIDFGLKENDVVQELREIMSDFNVEGAHVVEEVP